jgi:hypothetical protein
MGKDGCREVSYLSDSDTDELASEVTWSRVASSSERPTLDEPTSTALYVTASTFRDEMVLGIDRSWEAGTKATGKAKSDALASCRL